MKRIGNWKLSTRGGSSSGREIGNSSQSEAGFTLIEVLVSSAILVILAMGFLSIQYVLSQNQVSAWRNYLSIESANVAMSAIVHELRDARASDIGSYTLEVANDQEIIFYSDYDYDGVVERIRYSLSGYNLTKGIVEPSGSPLSYPLASEKTKVVSDIVQNATQPIFYYYNSDWPSDTTNNPLTASDRIAEARQVKIILITNADPDDTKNDYVLESDVRLRMLY